MKVRQMREMHGLECAAAKMAPDKETKGRALVSAEIRRRRHACLRQPNNQSRKVIPKESLVEKKTPIARGSMCWVGAGTTGAGNAGGRGNWTK